MIVPNINQSLGWVHFFLRNHCKLYSAVRSDIQCISFSRGISQESHGGHNCTTRIILELRGDQKVCLQLDYICNRRVVTCLEIKRKSFPVTLCSRDTNETFVFSYCAEIFQLPCIISQFCLFLNQWFAAQNASSVDGFYKCCITDWRVLQNITHFI